MPKKMKVVPKPDQQLPDESPVAVQEPELDIEDQVNAGAMSSPTPAQVATTPAEALFRNQATGNLLPPSGTFSPPAQTTPTPFPGVLRPFGDVMKLVAVGMTARREAWGEDRTVVFLRGDVLHLRKPEGTEHAFLVHKLDILAEDWIVQ